MFAPLVASVLAVVAALVLPTTAPRPAVGPRATGPARLSNVWPSARTFTIDASLPGGVGFEPMVVVDATTTVGVATSADHSIARLVVRIRDAPLRVLQVVRSSDVMTVAAVVVEGDQVFWLESGPDAEGRGTTSVWRSGLRDGRTRLLNTAVSDLAYFDSQYDLELVDGRLYWAAYVSHGRGEIWSISIDGGSLTVRSFGRLYGLTTWPWITSSAGDGNAGDVDMINLRTGEHRTVKGTADQYLNCTPAWCRVTTLVNQNTDIQVTLEHPDGTHVVGFAHHSLSPVNTDVALLDRFEVVESAAGSNPVDQTQLIWLHDLTNGRDVLLDQSATGQIGSRNGFLWWSTGDNEATVWHVLDLRQLT